MGLIDRITNWFGRGGVESPSIAADGSGGLAGLIMSQLGGGGRGRWVRDAGNVATNSAVYSAIAWLQRRTSEPRLRVMRPGRGKAEQSLVEVSGHPLPTLFEEGADFDGTILLSAIMIDLICTGNAYLGVQTQGLGRGLGGFVPLPAKCVEPRGDRYVDPANPRMITYYRYSDGNGRGFDIGPDEVVHVRVGYNPDNPMLGVSPVHASLREIVTDNEAATLNAALLQNGGVMGLAFEPSEGEGRQVESLGIKRIEDLENKMRERLTSARAGSPTIMPISGTWKVIGYKPDELQLTSARALAVARILSPLGLDPMALGLPSENKTYSNYAEATDSAHEQLFFPYLAIIARALTRQVLRVRYPQQAGYRVDWDLSQVRAAQPDLDALASRWGRLYVQGVATRADARAALSMPVDIARDNVYIDEMRSGARGVARARRDRSDLRAFEDLLS